MTFPVRLRRGRNQNGNLMPLPRGPHRRAQSAISTSSAKIANLLASMTVSSSEAKVKDKDLTQFLLGGQLFFFTFSNCFAFLPSGGKSTALLFILSPDLRYAARDASGGGSMPSFSGFLISLVALLGFLNTYCFASFSLQLFPIILH